MELELKQDPLPAEEAEAHTRKVRHRKKQFLRTLRHQMEFYFSDANLSKNRFMGQLVSKDPQVDLSLFLTFNKIRALTSDLDDIVKALKRSELLVVSEDGTKIYRKTPIREKSNADECTIYVEQLPPDTDHEWLKGVFLPYGNVPYISIPKYSHNGLNKGFAFVEFDTPESASKALDAFRAMGCQLTSDIPLEQICSIVTTQKFYSVDDNHGVYDHNEYDPLLDQNVKMPSEKEKFAKSKKKSKLRNSVDGGLKDTETEDTNTRIPSKGDKMKQDYIETPGEKVECVGEESESNKIVVKLEPEELQVVESRKRKIKESDAPEDNVTQKETRSKRKKSKSESCDEKEAESDKKRKKSKSESCDEKEAESDKTAIDAAECSSKKRKRKKSRSEESDSKEHLQDELLPSKKPKTEIKEELVTDDAGGEDSKDDEKENEGTDEVRKKKKTRHHKKKSKKDRPDPEPKTVLRILSKLEWKRLRNKYLLLQKLKMKQLKQHLSRSPWVGGNSQDYHHHGNSSQEFDRDGRSNQREEDAAKEEAAEKAEKRFEFTPGVIIHVRLPEPPADLKKFKTDAKAHAEVKYVDAREGWNEAYIRCSTAEAANQMVAQQTWPQMDIMTGQEEKSYWEKMDRDREVKFSRTERVKRRGKAKLLAKAEKAAGKHIRFTTDEDSAPKG